MKRSCIASRASYCWRARRNITPEAETCFHQALDVARRQQAKSLGAAGLRRASVASGSSRAERAKAHELLAPIYGWFTEGFDTKDLQAGQGLLEALQ